MKRILFLGSLIGTLWFEVDAMPGNKDLPRMWARMENCADNLLKDSSFSQDSLDTVVNIMEFIDELMPDEFRPRRMYSLFGVKLICLIYLHEKDRGRATNGQPPIGVLEKAPDDVKKVFVEAMKTLRGPSVFGGLDQAQVNGLLLFLQIHLAGLK
ncbi:MAG: hypothetical protein LBQ08_00125 [Holosporaceae bacterium]|jgi:hypothetical protein|nr:hypothetical protein [Holosporaceae bacterium]